MSNPKSKKGAKRREKKKEKKVNISNAKRDRTKENAYLRLARSAGGV